MYSKSVAKAQSKYNKSLYRYPLKMNRVTNPKEIEHLEKQENKNAYLIRLISEDMKKNENA